MFHFLFLAIKYMAFLRHFFSLFRKKQKKVSVIMSVCCARPDHPSPCAHTFLFLLSRLLLSRSPVRLPDFRLRLSYVLHHFSFPATTPSFRRLRLRCLPPALPLLFFSRHHPVISTSPAPLPPPGFAAFVFFPPPPRHFDVFSCSPRLFFHVNSLFTETRILVVSVLLTGRCYQTGIARSNTSSTCK